jgi:hypothetical protein
MTTGNTSFALSVLQENPYSRIANGGVQAALTTIGTQLGTYRSQATAYQAAQALRMLIEDILRAQSLQVDETALPAAGVCEGLITDGTAQTAMGTIRTYLTSFGTAGVPPTGALKSKHGFELLANLIVQSI